MITFLSDDLYKIWVYMCKLLNWQCQCLVRNSYKNIVWMMSMQNLKMEGWKWRKRILHTLKICCNGHHMFFRIRNLPIYQLFSRKFLCYSFLVAVKQRLMIFISRFWSLLAHHMFSRILNLSIYQIYDFFCFSFSVVVKQRLMILIFISRIWSLLAHHMFSRILNQRIYQLFLTKFSLFFILVVVKQRLMMKKEAVSIGAPNGNLFFPV